jgi:peptidoglycan hydrolase CwlO-like protein
MNTKEMYADLVKESLQLVDTCDVSDQFSNLDIEMGSTIMQKTRTLKNLENTHANIMNEIKKINTNNKELSNSINESKREISEIFQ